MPYLMKSNPFFPLDPAGLKKSIKNAVYGVKMTKI